jgi:3-isopropylmalate/(R)-2-methylmalate dehydratase small subunit
MSDFVWTLRGTCYKLGHDVPHADGVIPARFITDRETSAEVMIPHLFEATDPGFHSRCRPGDIIVTGRNFGVGPKSNGYIAMQALGLGLVCESIPVQSYRGAVNCGLRVLSRCENVTAMCDTGDELEVDFYTGQFINHSRNTVHLFAPVPEAIQDLIAKGGNDGWLKAWWEEAKSTQSA